jgi:hypothetical protein
VSKPRLLVLFARADHPHRDPVCATLAWLAAERGRLFECYFAAPASGGPFAGGHPAFVRPDELRGGTLTGGHHLEQLYRLLVEFDVEAVLLGPGPFDALLTEAGLRVLASSDNVAELYWQLLINLDAKRADGLLVVGDGGRPQGVPLTAFAYPEITNRRLLAIAAGDGSALESLRGDLALEALWLAGLPPKGAVVIESTSVPTVAGQTAWMARRWEGWAQGYMLADPELAGRWTPHAARNRLVALFGVPQREVIELMREPLARQAVVLGRPQGDHELVELSKAGVALQHVDPARPPFPVLGERVSRALVAPASEAQDPDDAQLERWAADRRVLASLLFWTGMIRDLEGFYALADVLAMARLACGVVLTTASFQYMPHPPLSLLEVDAALGGLAPQVEALLGSGGIGALLESRTPPDRLAAALKDGVRTLADQLGGRDRVPRGWWGVMDPVMRPARRPRVSWRSDPPYLRVHRRGQIRPAASPTEDEADRIGSADGRPNRVARSLRALLGSFVEPLQPFDGYALGPPGKAVLEAVRDAGFEYAFTKSAPGPRSWVVRGVEGVTVMNHTAGRWEGSPPFVTVSSVGDLRRAERKLLSRQRPGWLVGSLATSLWALSGSRWERGERLREMCGLLAGGGASGRLVNVPPRVVARYARLLADKNLVDRVDAV